MSAEAKPPNAATLDSWKEIARYLDRGVRTVQRWHETLGLPVHHSNGGGRKAIFALRSELDQWLRNCPTETRPLTNTRPKVNAAGNGHNPIVTTTRELMRKSRHLRHCTQNSWVELTHTIMELQRTICGISSSPLDETEIAAAAVGNLSPGKETTTIPAECVDQSSLS